MITPVFEITQTDDSLIFKIRAPYAKLGDLEVDYTEKLFLFSCPPYYLRIHLPNDVQENSGDNTTYDSDTGLFTVTVPKVVKGQFFEGLDMITELLRPQKPPTAEKVVEEIEDEENHSDDEEYYQEQKLKDVKSEIKDETANTFGYGFGWRRSGVLEQLREQIGKLIDLEEPEHVPLTERVEACEAFDRTKFDYERYLLDNLQPTEELHGIVDAGFEAAMDITEKDRTKLKDLPKRKLPSLSNDEELATAYSLVDIIFSWAYDQRINGWEPCCESGWTITHISPSLSFLVKWNNLKQTCVGAVRRSLCYPLYRNWDLSIKVLEDTLVIFTKGKSALVHALCDIHSIMISSSEFHYLLNDLFLTDLLIWVQACNDDFFNKISQCLSEIKVGKEEVNLDLDEIELNGRVLLMAIDNQNDVDSDDEI